MPNPLKSPFSYAPEWRETVEAVFLSGREFRVEFDSAKSARGYRATFYAFVKSAENAVFVTNKLNLDAEERKVLLKLYQEARQISCWIDGSAAVLQVKSGTPHAEAMRKALDIGPQGAVPRVSNEDEAENEAIVARLIERERRKREREMKK